MVWASNWKKTKEKAISMIKTNYSPYFLTINSTLAHMGAISLIERVTNKQAEISFLISNEG